MKKEISVKIFRDGDVWCVMQGVNLQEGIVGFGKNFAAAFMRFGKAYQKAKDTTPHFHQALWVDSKLTDDCGECAGDVHLEIHQRNIN